MNNNEIIKIKELKQEKRKIINELQQINQLLSRYKYSFKYKESIEALKRIDTYCQDQSNKSKEIDQNIAEIAETLEKNCNHKIIINHLLNFECPICKKNFEYNTLPLTTEYIIENINDENDLNSIDEIILNSVDEKSAEKDILNHVNNLQYSNNIKIRRKTL